MTLRVVLADDHPMYRYGLTAVLDQADGVDVVASVGDGAALIAAVPRRARRGTHRPRPCRASTAWPPRAAAGAGRSCRSSR